MSKSKPLFAARTDKSLAADAVAERLQISKGTVLTALREDWTVKGTPAVRRKMKAILEIAELLGLSGAVKAKEIVVPELRTPGRVEDLDGVDEPLTERLRSILADDGYYLLVEHYGGTRLYVPADPERSELPNVLTLEHAQKLSQHFGGEYFRVPLDRQFLAKCYFDQGLTIRQVAIRLRMTEGGIDKLKSRMRKCGINVG